MTELSFSKLHPATCFIYFVGSTLLFILLLHPLYLCAALCSLLIFNFFLDRGKRLREWLIYFLLMSLIIFLLNPLLIRQGSQIIFTVFQYPIYIEGILFGLTAALSLLCMLILFVAYNEVIQPNKFLYLFSKVLPRGALLTMLAVRFVPLCKRRLSELHRVQQTKHYDGQEGKRNKLKYGMSLLALLLAWSLEEALQTADSMQARGYGIRKQRSSYLYYRWTHLDSLILLWVVTFFCLCIAGWFLSYAEWLTFASYLCFSLLPVVLEGIYYFTRCSREGYTHESNYI